MSSWHPRYGNALYLAPYVNTIEHIESNAALVLGGSTTPGSMRFTFGEASETFTTATAGQVGNLSSEYMSIFEGGNVTIGSYDEDNINTSEYKLDVAGDINFTGTIYNNGVEFSGGSEWNRNGNKIYYNTDNVGIGTNNPSNAKLEINGTNGSVSFGVNSYAELSSNGVKLGAATTASYSIYASGAIAGSEFNAISDIRVKEIKNERNINDDLNIIKNIKTYNYEFLDKLEHQDTKKIGFIAQEIEKINQDFVNKSKRFIPNIYKVFHFVAEDEIEIYNDTDININDILKIEVKHSITNSYESFIVKVIDKQENKIKIYGKEYNINKDDILFDENVFIYGKFVNDFLTIDINQILSINTNCIKYLINKKEDYDRDITIIKKKLNI